MPSPEGRRWLPLTFVHREARVLGTDPCRNEMARGRCAEIAKGKREELPSCARDLPLDRTWIAEKTKLAGEFRTGDRISPRLAARLSKKW